MLDSQKTISELMRTLMARAEERFGKERATELHSEIEQMAAELHKLTAAPIEVDDEP
jgi:hypothetical protein